MAKSKQDYIDQGAADFTSGNQNRRDQFKAGSWQQVAYAEGWDSANLSAASQTQAECIDSAAEQPTAIRTFASRMTDPLYATACALSSHISDLLQQSANKGDKRSHRLRKKATVLINKWGPVLR